MEPFKLFTSIKPPANADDLAYLRDCLHSWHTAGFSPVAVNGPKETEALRPLNLPTEFSPLLSDGKPRIGSILSAIRDSGAPVAGIINSDCKIAQYPHLAVHLRANLEQAVLLAWRIDLNEDRNPTPRLDGYDGFFFDTGIMPKDDAGFCVGEPLWDFWFPLACEMTGAQVQTLRLPLLTHRAHPQNWGTVDLSGNASRLWGLLQTWHRRGDMPDSLRATLPDALCHSLAPSKDDLMRVCEVPPFWLFEQRPQNNAVLGPDATDIEAMLRCGGQSMYKDFRVTWLRAKGAPEYADTKAELNRVKAELHETRHSTSWRVTAPVRRAAMMVRAIAAQLL